MPLGYDPMHRQYCLLRSTAFGQKLAHRKDCDPEKGNMLLRSTGRCQSDFHTGLAPALDKQVQLGGRGWLEV